MRLAAGGMCATEIARRLNIPRSTVRDWLAGRQPRLARTGRQPWLTDSGGVVCSKCNHEHNLWKLDADYAYLLGLYLGDGFISAHRRGVYRLRIVLDEKYPGIIASAAATIGRVRGGKALVQARPTKCVEVPLTGARGPACFRNTGREESTCGRSSLLPGSR